ncbi:protein DOG1-like 3 [Solanum dulcamara]|uniref:protein DOG1-like 3 n=1 Tax=Solanum dulcamara TaxID=45834 RepID=UPI0024862331|nr:protein DOG1-like 3 [Solanum dulcamara]
MILQRKEVTDLEEAAAEAKKGLKTEDELTQLIDKTVQNFQDYVNKRSQLDVLALFVPTSCTPLETSVLWIAGCRPSSFIRFEYALCGMDTDSHLNEFLQGKRGVCNLTAKQMNMIDTLQAKTIKQERILSSRLASLQEDIVDQRFASKIKNKCENADEDLDEHSRCMAGVMEEADELRMKTLKEIVLIILEPLQAVEYLTAAKKMRLCLQKWGEKRDHQHTNK